MWLIILLVLSIVFIIISSTKFKMHPFLSLTLVSILFALFAGLPVTKIADALNDGFGVTIGKIGLVIILGVIIGVYLEYSGGGMRMAESVLNLIGRERVYAAMAIIGYILSIPVFFDSAFLLMSPLNKSLTKRAGLSLAGTAMALSIGLVTTHVLVPPTPGPIATAGMLGADIGLVMVMGIGVGIPCVIFGILFAKYYASKIYIDPNPELTEEVILERLANAPSTFKSSLPIVIPLLLIVAKSVLEFMLPEGQRDGMFIQSILFIGHPVLALTIGMFLAFGLPAKFSTSHWSDEGWVGQALRDAANIILITGAGGIFGNVLKVSGIAEELGTFFQNQQLGIWLPFILAAAIKSAHGSSTVAMITTASIMASMMESFGFVSPIDKALVVTAIGAGAMVASHVNDSGYWVVVKMSNMTITQGYKLQTLGTGLNGLVAGLVVYILSLIL